jgi:hypothetical protein
MKYAVLHLSVQESRLQGDLYTNYFWFLIRKIFKRMC